MITHSTRGTSRSELATPVLRLTALIGLLIVSIWLGRAASTDAATNVFTSTTAISVPENGLANPYPSTVSVTGFSGTVTKVAVTLTNVTHAFPSDLDILLVGPNGHAVLLMSDAGSTYDLNGVSLTFDDEAVSPAPRFSKLTEGRYRPTNHGSPDAFPAPAPAAPYGTSLAAFNGIDPNGDWSLYIVDDAFPDAGGVAGGWSISLATGSAPMLEPVAAQTLPETGRTVVPISATDPDGDAIELTASGLPPFATFSDHGDGTGTLVLEPGYDDAGAYSSITITATDGAFFTRQSVTATVTNVNRTPILEVIPDQQMPVQRTRSLTISASDPDGDAIVLSTSGLPGFASMTDHADGTATLALSPAQADAGVYPNLMVTASDGDADVAQTFTIEVSGNSAPSLMPVTVPTVAEAESISLSVSATDPDNDPLQISATGLPPFATLNDHGDGTGALVISPGYDDAGRYETLAIDVTDGGYTASASLSLTVIETNRAPELQAIGPQTASEGRTVSVAVAASDPDGQMPSLSAANLPAFATFTDYGDGTGAVSLTPEPGDAATYTALTIEATDGALTATASFDLTIVPNQAPVLARIGDQALDDSTTLDVQVTATDGNNDELTFTATGLPGFASLVDLGNGTNVLRIAPGPTDSGTYAGAVISVSDGLSTGTEPITILVHDVNQPPIADAGQPMTVGDVNGDGSELITLDGSNSFDPDGTIVRAEWRQNDVVIATDPVVSATLALGTHVFTLTVTDDDGASVTSTLEVIIRDAAGPSATLAMPSPPSGGWFHNAVTLDISATDTVGGVGVQEIVYMMTGAQTGGATVPGASASLVIDRDGETTVTWHAVDRAGNHGPVETRIIQIDRELPRARVLRSGLVPGQIIGRRSALVAMTWTAIDEASGVARALFQLDSGAGFGSGKSSIEPAQSRSIAFGTTTRFRVRPTDWAGLVGTWSTSRPFTVEVLQETDARIAYAGRWNASTWKEFVDGSARMAAKSDAIATLTFQGSSVGFVTTLGPNRGMVEVWLDGSYVETIDLYAPTAQGRALGFTANDLQPTASHTIEIRPLGQRNPQATGSLVHVDAFVIIHE